MWSRLARTYCLPSTTISATIGRSKDDNILIYFAGHGASYDANAFFKRSHDQIEALCPSDRGKDTKTDKLIPDISDRELSIILMELHDIKGGNISVVLDCCHSGGATREAAGTRVRAGNPLSDGLKLMLRAADKDSRRLDKTKKACDEKLGWDPNTSVLIAACTAGERAKEGDFDGKAQGYFTRALLRVLRDEAHKDKTYTDIGAEITKLIPSYKGSHVQNPLVLGERQHCRMWFVDDGSDADSDEGSDDVSAVSGDESGTDEYGSDDD